MLPTPRRGCGGTRTSPVVLPYREPRPAEQTHRTDVAPTLPWGYTLDEGARSMTSAIHRESHADAKRRGELGFFRLVDWGALSRAVKLDLQDRRGDTSTTRPTHLGAYLDELALEELPEILAGIEAMTPAEFRTVSIWHNVTGVTQADLAQILRSRL